MNRKKDFHKNFFIMTVFASLIVILITLTYLYINLLSITGKIVTAKAIDFDEENKLMAMDNMRFKNKSIGYKISDNCNDVKITNVLDALYIMEALTILEFRADNLNPELLIDCSRLEEEKEGILGYGGPNLLLNTGKYNLIINSTVHIIKEEECSLPITALHEILHALGFLHSKNEKSLLYKHARCDVIIEKEIRDKINELYNEEPSADLKLNSINISKNHNFVDADISFSNIGLSELKKVYINLSKPNKLIKEYEIGELEIGQSKTLSIEDLEVGSFVYTIKFEIFSDGYELNKANNLKEIFLK